ncbi:MAG: hypothetical protein AAF840_04540, partial [Bacteroidota bacterium]
MTVLHSSKRFSLDSLPIWEFDLLRRIPQKDTLHAIRLIHPRKKYDILKRPKRTTFHKFGNMVIKIDHLERYHGHSKINCSAQKYSFSSMKEDSLSLTFFDIKPIYSTNLHDPGDSIRVPKGNINLHFAKDASVSYISVKILIEATTDLYVYDQDLQTSKKILPNRFMRCLRNYSFVPVDSMAIPALSDFGIFKERK